MENIGLQDSLLSRFDLLFIMLDQMDPEQDREISDHVLRMHRYRTPGEQDGDGEAMRKVRKGREPKQRPLSQAQPRQWQMSAMSGFMLKMVLHSWPPLFAYCRLGVFCPFLGLGMPLSIFRVSGGSTFLICRLHISVWSLPCESFFPCLVNLSSLSVL